MNTEEAKIFVVDDDPVFTKMISHRLAKNFKDIQTFNNGYECLSQLHQLPQIIILDHYLKDDLGINILKDIKEYDSEIHVVYVSGQTKASIAVKALRNGAVAYLEKSEADLNELVNILEKIRR